MRASRITGPAITASIGQRQREEIVAGERATARRHRRAAGAINREVSLLLPMLRLGLEHQKLTRLSIVHKPKEAAPVRRVLRGRRLQGRVRACRRTCRSR